MTARPLPSWLKALGLGLAVVLVVGGLAILAALVPPLGDAVARSPVTIVVLIVGTVLVLGATIRSTLRRR